MSKNTVGFLMPTNIELAQRVQHDIGAAGNGNVRGRLRGRAQAFDAGRLLRVEVVKV